MSTVLNQTFQPNYSYQKSPSLTKRFFAWTAGQQKNSLLWVAIGLAAHGCAITPVTLYIVFLSGLHLSLFMTALAAMAMTLIVNLAAMPTKITIPVFFASVVIDLVVIASAIALAVNG